jgi:minor histocompatibility antigen H13
MRFPIVGSALLFGLFVAFKFLPKELVNAVLSAYFAILGALALIACAEPLVALRAPAALRSERTISTPKIPFLLPDGLQFSFTGIEAFLALPALSFCVWYYATKHWAANNALGLAFSLQGIEHLSLGATQHGAILLAGLFVYDVFWVFCTPVMVSVAKSFDAPIKLLFPKALALALAPEAPRKEFSMLGLGDIVIPGIFVALMLRYDAAISAENAGKKTDAATGVLPVEVRPRVFLSVFTGYVAGLIATLVAMHWSGAAQPALLYIVPAVLATTAAHGAATGDMKRLWIWHEGPAAAGDNLATGGKKEEDEGAAGRSPTTAVVEAVVEAEASTPEGAKVVAPKRVTRSAVKEMKKDA